MTGLEDPNTTSKIEICLVDAKIHFDASATQPLPTVGSVLFQSSTTEEEEIAINYPVDWVAPTEWALKGFLLPPLRFKHFGFFIKSTDGVDIAFAWFSDKDLRQLTTQCNEEAHFAVVLDLNVDDDWPLGKISVGFCVIPPSIGIEKRQGYSDVFSATTAANPDLLIQCLLNLEGDSTLKRCMLKICGEFFLNRYKDFKNSEDLNQALFVFGFVTHYNEQVGLAEGEVLDCLSAESKHGDLQRVCLEKLADTYVLSFKQDTSRFKHLDAAISIYRLLVQHISVTYVAVPRLLNSLSCALHVRYSSHQGQDLEDITEAISLLRKAMDIAPEMYSNSINRQVLGNFGSACRQLCYHTFDPELFSQGFFALQRALDMTPVGDPEISHRTRDVANGFLQRFQHLQDTEDLLQAITFHKRVIELTPAHEPSLPEIMTDLGRALRQLYQVTQDPQDLTKAILIHRNAIERAQLLQNRMSEMYNIFLQLGESVRVRYWVFSGQEDFDEAEEAFKKALAFTPEGHHERSNVLEVIALLHIARGLKAMAGHTLGGNTLTDMLSSLETSSTSSKSPTTKMMMSSLQALFQKHAAGGSNDRKGLAAYAAAIDIFPEVAGLEQRVEVRHQKLMQMKSFMLLGVARAIELEELGMAVEWMERMRCWVWNQISQLRAPLDDVRAHNDELATRMERITRQLDDAGSRSTLGCQQVYSIVNDIPQQEDSHRHVRLVKEWNQTIEEVRAIPQLKDFLRPPKIADLLGGIPDEGPVILLNVDFRQCDAIALLAHSDQPILIPLTAQEKELQSLRVQLYKYLSFKGMRSRGAAEDPNEDVGIDSTKRGGRPRPLPPVTVLTDILSYLWTRIVKPVLDALAYSPSHNTCRRIWWCTTGPLAFLPLHAAGIYGQKECCLSDYAISSYIPTVSTLIEKVHKTSRLSNRLLLVGQADAPGFTPIPATTEEVAAVAACVQDIGEVTVLEGVDATKEAVKQKISSYGSIHLACHGIQQTGEPLKSGFELRGGRLDLIEIINLKQHNPQADLAFLSACQTSAGDENSPEEAVHLAAGMLAAGYRSVVATSWSIKDAYGPEVAKNFYDRLAEGCTELEGTRSAPALHSAVQRLRRKVGDTEAGLLTWVPYVHFGV